MSFSEDNVDVEQAFALARSGYSQVMLMLRSLDGEAPCPPDLTYRIGIVKESVQRCTVLLQALFRLEAAKLQPSAEARLGELAALVKGYYDSQWQGQVVKSNLVSQPDGSSADLHKELAVARISHCLNELLDLVKSDKRASKQTKICLGIHAQLLQMHCLNDGLALAEEHADYRALFFREFHPRILMFAPQIVTFMITLLNRAAAVLPRED
jgi:hypothetical protein